jgi:PAS domain S-box-containing protein
LVVLRRNQFLRRALRTTVDGAKRCLASVRSFVLRSDKPAKSNTNQESQGTVGKQHLLRYHYILLGAILCIGAGVSVGGYWTLRVLDRTRLESDFDIAVATRTAILAKFMEAPQQVASLLQTFVAARDEIDRETFRKYVRDTLKPDSSIKVLGWIPRVTQGNRDAYEQAFTQATNLAGNFTEWTKDGLKGRSLEKVYYPIYCAEPFAVNMGLLEFDLGSNAKCLEAMKRSCESGTATSARLVSSTLGSSDGVPIVTIIGEKNYALFLPVYDKTLVFNTATERNAGLRGFVLVVFEAAAAISGSNNSVGIDVYVSDPTDTDTPVFLSFMRSYPRADWITTWEYYNTPPPGGLRSSQSLKIADRKWTAVCTATPEFVSERRTLQPMVPLIAGPVLTVIFAALTLVVMIRSIKAKQMAAELLCANEWLEKEVKDRLQAEEALLESQKRFSQIAEHAGEWIWEVDINGFFSYCSPAVEGVLGYRVDELVGKRHFWEFFDPDAQPGLKDQFIMSMVHGTHITKLINVNRHRSGRAVVLETGCLPVLDKKNNIVGYRGVNTDVTERKHLEDELRQSRDTLEQRVLERTAELEQANAHLQHAQMELVSSEKMSMLGQLAAGVGHEINTPTGAILNVTADSCDHLRQLAALAGEIGSMPLETHQWFYGIVSDVLGNLTVQSELANRTQRREVEGKLRQAGIEESRRIAEVVVSGGLANKMDDTLLKQLAIKPLLAFLEHVLAMKASVEIAQSSAKKIARIVRAMRFYSRGENSGTCELDTNESIENTLVILQHRIKNLVKVELDLEQSMPMVACGPELSQVWTNLLNNACDAIEMAKLGQVGRIAVTSRLIGGMVAVTVHNAGPAIPQEVIDKIFKPFFTTKPMGVGTGLGLSICANILSKCGGSIEVCNEGDGVTFRVTIPISKPADQPTTAASTSTSADTPQKVLAGVGETAEGASQS